MSVEDIMRRRLEVDGTSAEKYWMECFFLTSDAIAYHPDRKFKICLDCENLKRINRNSKLKDGFLVLEEGVYESLEGEEFKYDEVESSLEKTLTFKQVTRNPVWRTVARDTSLLKLYSSKISGKWNEKYNYKKWMDILTGSIDCQPFEVAPCLNSLYFNRLLSGSDLYCSVELDSEGSYIVSMKNDS